MKTKIFKIFGFAGYFNILRFLRKSKTSKKQNTRHIQGYSEMWGHPKFGRMGHWKNSAAHS